MSAPRTNWTSWFDVFMNIITTGFWSLWMKFRCRRKC